MPEVLFVRHGESEANRENRIVSHAADPELTDRGREEAQIMAQAWSDHEVAAVYASPLKRTMETAEAFLRPSLVVKPDDRLHEIALGRWDGQIVDDIEVNDGDRYHQWKHDPELGAPEGGEPLSTVGVRIQSFLADVREAHPHGLVVAATHSDCLKALVLSVLEAPWKSAQWVHLSNTAGFLVEWKSGHWQLMVRPIVPVP